MTEGKADDVHGGGHIDGDGKVVGRHFEGDAVGHTTMLVGSREKIDVGEQAQLFFRAESSY